MERPKYIIVIGTSAGGANALNELVSQLNSQMDAAFFIVMHLSKTGISDYLVNRLSPLTDLSCEVAKDAMLIEKGKIYIAPSNEHLIIIKDQVVVGHGPEENRWRPSIDVLFRSAAAAYNSSVIGIILTGLLNDGTSGMSAIKRSGGICIVQDPNEAEFPDMPLNVLNALEADHCIALADMGKVLFEIFKQEPVAKQPPEDVLAEASMASNMTIEIDDVRRLGEHAIYACPDCGGGLYRVEGDLVRRYRCHVGHAYEEAELAIKQGENVEATLWVALRMMEERFHLFRKIAGEHSKKGLERIATTYERSATDIQFHIEKLKKVLIAIQNSEKIPKQS
jgi:two-component system, chemotaxis family, protein-glutamate methylesterase/glutaminase